MEATVFPLLSDDLPLTISLLSTNHGIQSSRKHYVFQWFMDVSLTKNLAAADAVPSAAA